MDIITIIEKYIELSIRRDNLNNTIDNAKRYYNYSKIEGDMAFYDKDYQLEKQYNESAKHHIETQEKAQKELVQVEQLLKITHQTYTNLVQTLDELQLKEAITIISAKKIDAERKIEELTQRRNWANSKGDVAFNNKNYQEEEVYNKIATNCYFEIESINPTIHYYNSFINDLNYYINKKNEPNGPVK